MKQRLATAAVRVRSYVVNPANRGFLVAVLAMSVLHGVVFFATMTIAPIGFDEAFNLQAPLNLVQGNGYATEDWLYGGPRIPFDAIVSTGPLVEMPAALMFLIFGTSIEAARIVMLPFYGILLGSLFVLGRRIGGRWIGLASALVVLALNTRVDWAFTVVYGPSDALGEYAAAALLALALVLLRKHPMLSGLVLGLATLTKFIAFMAVPAFMIALVLVPTVAVATRGWGIKLRQLVLFAVVVFIPTVVWEIVKLLSLGFTGYGAALVNYLRFLFRSGSGIDGSADISWYLYLQRFARLFAGWHIPTTLVGIMFIVLLGLAAITIVHYIRSAPEAPSAPTHPAVRAIRSIPVEIWAAAGTLGVWGLWWTFISTSGFIRHTMPALLVAVPVVVALALQGARILFRSVGWRRVAAGVFVAGYAVVSVWQVSMTVESSFRAEEWTRAQQIQAADFVRDSGFTEVQGIGWWAAPEVRFLSHVPSKPIGTGTGPLVLEPILRTLDINTYTFGLGLCVDILYSEDGFVVCAIDPDTKPQAVAE